MPAIPRVSWPRKSKAWRHEASPSQPPTTGSSWCKAFSTRSAVQPCAPHWSRWQGVRALDNGLVPQRAHVQVTASLETLLGLPGAPAADMEFSLPISAKAVERIACDCAVTRVVLGSESTVIDVGRAKRTISGPQRKALKVRDCGCTWPGCDRPVSMTEGHHLVHWIQNGPGDLPNLTLLCYRHHWMVHEGGWQIVRTDDGRMITIPPPTGFERLPRGPD